MKKSKKKNKKKNQNYVKNNATQGAQSSAPYTGGISFNSVQVIYQRNMQALQQHYPDLARRVSTTHVTNYRIVPSSSGGIPNLYIPANNAFYYDQAGPVQDVQAQLEALKLKNTRLAVFLGLGLGYQTLHFAQNMAKEQNTNYLLVIEKDLEIFKAALKSTNLVPLLENPRANFMVALPEESLYVEIRNYLAENSRFMLLKATKPVYHLSALKLHKDYYLNALKQLRESGAHQLLHFGNDPHDSLIGVENMLENLNEIIFNPGINLLFNKFQGKPGIVVATGPSLNKNKHLLKGLEDKALIISVDASLKILLKMGVKPHLVTSLERVPAVVKLIEGINKEEVEDIYLAACPVVRNEVYQAYPGPRIIVYRNFDHFKWLGIDRGILNIQLSAGNMAFKVAQALGCDPIILIGQDLAFSKDGYTHAKGTALGEKQDNVYKIKTLNIMGNDGQPILTTETWYSFLKAYELDVAGYNGTCINSTEGGAYIQGTKIMPFQEAIEQYIKDTFDPLSCIKNSIASFTTAEAERDFLNVKELIEKTSADMESVIDNCKQGLQLYEHYKEELFGLLADPGKNTPLKEKIHKVHAQMLQPKYNCIKQYHQTFQLFFMHILQSFNIKFEMEMLAVPEKHDDKDIATADILIRHKEWYSVVADLARICLDALQKAKESLEEKVPAQVSC
ncbi:MAG: 6-hydroxymethylpterin diphosphokinase MptE-like protein [Bacillota bacterium]